MGLELYLSNSVVPLTGTTTESREAGDGVSSILRTEDGKSSDAFTEPLFNELLDSGLFADLPDLPEEGGFYG